MANHFCTVAKTNTCACPCDYKKSIFIQWSFYFLSEVKVDHEHWVLVVHGCVTLKSLYSDCRKIFAIKHILY